MINRLLLIAFIASAMCAGAQNKPYITHVYDYVPAPGQFVNTLPAVTAGMTKDEVLKKVEQSICGYEDDGEMVIAESMISLGSYGGYVVFGFDHPLVNVKGERDLQILGNASQASPTSRNGSSEPGIVMVANDLNGPWYELAGSEHGNAKTQHDFSITYYKPDEGKTPTPHPTIKAITDTTYVAWTCNSVDSLQAGYLYKNNVHLQSYWPLWIDGASLSFAGTKLRCNAVDLSGKGSNWTQYFFDWGYVDNRPDFRYSGGTPTDVQNLGFDLDWAIDSVGNPVSLRSVKYIKVYCGVLQQCGWLGEVSTEVAGAIDLHPDAVPQSLAGDVNDDGTVDITDVNILINIILGNDQASKYGSRADVNGDGTIDNADVNAIINIILG